MDSLQRKVTIGPSIVLLVLVGLVAPPLNVAAQDGDAKTQTTEFGHSGNWNLKVGEVNGPINIKTLKVGAGLSQVVGDDQRFFVATGARSKEKGKKSTVVSSIAAYDTKTLEAIWSKSFESTLGKKQETFGGAGPASQATPLLINEKIIYLTFTGQLFCLKQEDGAVVWMKDLEKDFGATPVQFGFSASTIADPDADGKFVLLAAGEKGGLFHIDAQSGTVDWKSAPQTFSYATPVAATIGGKDQWIIVSRDEVIGVARDDGTKLWSHTLAEKGLTNVPTPLVLDDQNILISGQGVKGTKCLQITNATEWEVETVWSQRIQFFYTNWLKLDDRVILGCTDKYMAAIDSKTGQILGRFRGFGDGNILRTPNNQWLVADGKGKLTVLESIQARIGVAELKQTFSFATDKSFGQARCWTPLSQIGSYIATRAGDQMMLIDVSGASDWTKLEPNKKEKTFELADFDDQPAEPEMSSFEKIIKTFESDGADKAFRLYGELREAGKLTVEDRVQLIEAAKQQGMDDHAEQIRQHGREDFPNERAFR